MYVYIHIITYGKKILICRIQEFSRDEYASRSLTSVELKSLNYTTEGSVGMQDELRKKWHNAMDWELSSVRIHGWIKKKVRWITHRMYVMCVYMYMYACTLCVPANVRIHTYICINNTHQTCMRDTQNTYINTQYRYAWKRSDTRETRMRTNHVTSRAC